MDKDWESGGCIESKMNNTLMGEVYKERLREKEKERDTKKKNAGDGTQGKKDDGIRNKGALGLSWF